MPPWRGTYRIGLKSNPPNYFVERLLNGDGRQQLRSCQKSPLPASNAFSPSAADIMHARSETRVLLPWLLSKVTSKQTVMNMPHSDYFELSSAGSICPASALAASSQGRPAYQPATLLKIYVYGYLN